jgi:hypothetical protein
MQQSEVGINLCRGDFYLHILKDLSEDQVLHRSLFGYLGTYAVNCII